MKVFQSMKLIMRIKNKTNFYLILSFFLLDEVILIITVLTKLISSTRTGISTLGNLSQTSSHEKALLLSSLMSHSAFDRCLQMAPCEVPIPERTLAVQRAMQTFLAKPYFSPCDLKAFQALKQSVAFLAVWK